MKNISAICMAGAPLLAISNSSAQTATSAVDPDDDAPRYPGVFLVPKGVDVFKNAIKNPDGSLTIHPGQQVPEANEINRQFCEALGGVDKTNEMEHTISGQVGYIVSCSLPPDTEERNTNVTESPGTGTGRIYVPIPNYDYQTGRIIKKAKRPVPQPESCVAPLPLIIRHPPNGMSRKGFNYWNNGYAEFFSMPSTQQGSAVATVYETTPCTWTQSSPIGPGQAVLKGHIQCLATLDAAQSDLRACWNGYCATERGLVQHY
ncbi:MULTISPECIES: hypothetical protein [unclassified Undibacterium]|uniref:hypothetical protein n=1 Tax=unclassified Undibacterium TaxID=2630295 RepID=UPI002AC96F27|nr:MULTISPECIES: hypothetical protein [unclassified Undibacterium]MEB0137519.1 hypothetical protein [Undibacterium sp. CCC2.1]MEB0170816.1 hypothetical protein [Undibacterium sp. CCC1.1]MEB0174768.1 hypothetical protein [Undibacterium sp. CCC3.4]MEB0214104.1 hypothetical protein [Undibacterium sp. 5I2]WPX44420.1 hypothetical protein RHM61_04070 [Undibacterium sp. CCC3.4]